MAFEKKKVLTKKRVLFVNWKEVSGASVTKRVLRLFSNDNGEYICPISNCLHVGFKSKRGLRKHIMVCTRGISTSMNSLLSIEL